MADWSWSNVSAEEKGKIAGGLEEALGQYASFTSQAAAAGINKKMAFRAGNEAFAATMSDMRQALAQSVSRSAAAGGGIIDFSRAGFLQGEGEKGIAKASREKLAYDIEGIGQKYREKSAKRASYVSLASGFAKGVYGVASAGMG